MKSLPLVDLAPSADGDLEGIRGVASVLDQAYRTVGFCYIENHGVSDQIIDSAFSASREFHALPLELKERVAMNAWHRGYMAMATSKIVTSRVSKPTFPNQSESFMVMHELAPDDPDVVAGLPLAGPNQWPESLPGFRDAVVAYGDAMETLTRRLTRIMAVAFGLEPHALDKDFARPVTFLRMLHYPPATPDTPDGAFGSTPHTDYGFMTVLAQDENAALSVQLETDEWVDVAPRVGELVLNIGDMAERWSNGRWRATRHRVLNRTGRDRYSIPFFYDMSMNTVVSPLPTCTLDDAAAYDAVRYGDYLMERLDANYRYRNTAEIRSSAV